jgi:hypothetical protein
MNRASVSVIATNIVVDWDHTFGGLEDDGAISIIQTSDGGFAVTGRTGSYGAGDADIWLVKTDGDGKPIWNITYGGVLADIAFSVIQTEDGGFVLAGVTSSFGAGGRDFWVVKTDVNGQHEWNQTYGGPEDDVFRAIVQTTDGGFALLGGTRSYGVVGDQDWWLLKIDSNGQEEWNRTFGGSGNERGLSMVHTADGGFALVGGTTSYGVGGTDYWLIKTNATGDPEWNQTYGDTFDDFPNALTQTTDGGFVLAGAFMSYGAVRDIWLVKTDASGQHEWNYTYGGALGENCHWIIQSADGGLIFYGWTESRGAGGLDVWLVKTDFEGQMEWNQTFGGGSDDWGTSMLQTEDGEYVLTGFTRSFGPGNLDFWLIKVSESEETTTTTTSNPASSIGFEYLPFLLGAFAIIIFRNSRGKKNG